MSITYWQTHYNTSVLNYPDIFLKQVGKTVDGKEIDQKQVELIIYRIQRMLSLDKNDVLLDACCGNGFLTYRLSPFVAQIIGIDFSENLISIANKYHCMDNIYYVNSNLLDFKDFLGCNKILMYEALQHFTYEQFELLLKNIKDISEKCFLFYIASIPDKNRLWNYYDTKQKQDFYRERERQGYSHMGTWWEKQYLAELCQKCGMNVQFFDQDVDLYTSYYRFDMLISL